MTVVEGQKREKYKGLTPRARKLKTKTKRPFD